MSDPAAPSVGADKERHGKELYETGPWLIVHGHGTESEELAEKIAEQCAARGVSYEPMTADEARSVELRHFFALLVVLPTAAGLPTSLDDIAELVRTYRARRPDGLRSLLDGTRRWFEAGVVQLFGAAELLDTPAIRQIEQLICRYRLTGRGTVPAPFLPYEGGSAPEDRVPVATDLYGASVDVHRRTVTSWGIAWSRAEVSAVRQAIDGMRDCWESQTFSDLRRPDKRRQINRLDFLLDDPNHLPPESVCERKKWTEGGQRVVRKVLEDLGALFPGLGRPESRRNKKGLQREFHELYRALRQAEGLLSGSRRPFMKSAAVHESVVDRIRPPRY